MSLLVNILSVTRSFSISFLSKISKTTDCKERNKNQYVLLISSYFYVNFSDFSIILWRQKAVLVAILNQLYDLTI